MELTSISRYRILEKLGAGGMGEVYLAEDTKLGRKVALKLLAEELTQNRDRLSRFDQEAYAASALNHPNILTIYEMGDEGGRHYIATEYIDGMTLRKRMGGPPMELTEILDIAIQVTGALEEAHAAGIVHRDIKPENVMIRKNGHVKVLDFGLAKLTERTTAGEESGPRRLGDERLEILHPAVGAEGAQARERGEVSLGHPSFDQRRLGRVEADREHGSLCHRRPSYLSRSL